MWNWIKEETKKRKRTVNKEEYFDEMNIPYENQPEHDCYCCQFDSQFSDNCACCPIDWGIECHVEVDVPCLEGLYRDWWTCPADEWERAAELEGKIAELPERKEK